MRPKFEKGHKKTGGRKAGTPNKAADSIKDLLNRLLPEDRREREWEKNLAHKDPRIRWKAFELANSYLFGKPGQTVVGEEAAPPLNINISSIAWKRKLVD